MSDTGPKTPKKPPPAPKSQAPGPKPSMKANENLIGRSIIGSGASRKRR